MTHLEQALRDAVEKGGYKLIDLDGDPIEVEDLDLAQEWRIIPSDASFWQALGKARGWEKLTKIGNGKGPFKNFEHMMETWLLHWHRLIDTLASGGSVEDFFSKL